MSEFPFVELSDESSDIYVNLEAETAIDGMNAGLDAGMGAANAGEDVVAAATAAAEEAGVDVELAAAIGSLVGGLAVALVAAGLLVLFIALMVKESITIMVINNTPYNLSTSLDPASEQVYINHGKLTSSPSGAFPTNSSGVYLSGFVFQNHTASLLGPSGAVWMSITDPNNNNSLVGGLCIAFSDPVGGSNNGAVSFNQDLSSWFAAFNSGPITPFTSATLSGTPTLNATSAINPSGSKIVMIVGLSTS